MSTAQDMTSPPVKARTTSATHRARAVLGRDWKVAYPFVLPMVILMLGLILWPFLEAIRLSGTALNFLTGETTWVGFRNYARLPGNSDYLLAMGNTITFTMWSLAVKFVVGMTIALILNSKLPYRNILSGIRRPGAGPAARPTGDRTTRHRRRISKTTRRGSRDRHTTGYRYPGWIPAARCTGNCTT